MNKRLIRLKRCIAFLIAVLLLMQPMDLFSITASAQTVIWDGTLSVPTEKDRAGNILIHNGNELAYVIKNGGGADKSYKLTDDIYLNDITKINWVTGRAASGYTIQKWYDHNVNFQGSIDGDGHVIHGLYNDVTPKSNGPYGCALIPAITKNGTVHLTNLGIDHAYISHHNASAFVAVSEASSLVMDACYAGADVTLTGINAGAFRAYAKSALGGSITNCYSLATTNATNESGLVSVLWDASESLKIAFCYNAKGPISTSGAVSHAQSFVNFTSEESAFTEGVTVVPSEKMKGAEAFNNMPNLNVNDKYITTKGFPVLQVFVNETNSQDVVTPANPVAYSYKPYDPNHNLNQNYKYVWGDEFDGNALDQNKWSSKNTKMTGRNALIVEDTAQTISVKNGALKLTAYKDNEGNYHVPNSVHSQENMNYKYGYAEIKAKLSLEVGSFASFWTRSVSEQGRSLVKGDLDYYTEIDMFETFQNSNHQCAGGNILKNFPNNSSMNWYPTGMKATQQVVIPDEEYHYFGYEWNPDEIKLYYDGKIYARFDITQAWTEATTAGKGLPDWDRTARPDLSGTGMESFHEAQYLIFNHHLHYTGAFEASTSVTENTNFKNADYVIDYCRLYQLPDQEIYTKYNIMPPVNPTAAPTAKPTTAPTTKPTAKPTTVPTAKPTTAPTTKPTTAPTAKPTTAPTAKPTPAPTAKPTTAPTAKPTTAPTAKPTAAPTAKPTTVPTAKPTAAPTIKPTSVPTQNVTDVFADVPAGKWYVNAVQFVYDREIMQGKGEDPNGSGKSIFDPNANLTRAEFATVLYKMEGKPAVAFNNEILDVKNKSAWYAKPVHWVYEQNIAAGYPNGNYGVADMITREQLALMLYKYAKLKGYTTSYSDTALNRFGDVDKISSWAIEAMKWATTNGVMNGSAHEVPLLNPKGYATRAECASMIKSLLEKVAK